MMITDPVLINKVQRMIASRKRAHVSAADVLAVIQKETGGVGHFLGTEPLFKANLRAAETITGLTARQLLEHVTYKEGVLAGKFYKFRCEPGYWQWANGLKGSWTQQEKFLLSCSFGLGQKMARWLLHGVPGADWISFIHKFNRDSLLQIQYVCGDIDALLVQSKGNRLLAYTRYNMGTRDRDKDGKPDEIVSDYGRIVNGYRAQYLKAGL